LNDDDNLPPFLREEFRRQRPAHPLDPRDRGAPPPGDGTETPPIGERVRPNFRSLADFCAEFGPISYAVAGLMRDGSLYTLTGRTGEGKTAFLVILALAVALGFGEKLIGRKVKKGRVAFCTAENPDDLRMRFMIACWTFDIDPRVVSRDIMISDNRVAPEDIVERIREAGEDFALIVVDTWQAYFDGREPNNNAEAVSFTRRFRPLTSINSGHPVVVIAAHPPKQAGNDNLLPYGGGGTLNEVDGNFTFRIDENGLFRLHWLGKIRGLPFDPLHFKIDRLDSPDVVTIDGERVTLPVMFPVDQEAVDARGEALANHDVTLLRAMAAEPAGSERTWATATGFNRRAVQAILNRLKGDRLVTKKARRWSLTKNGEHMAKEDAGDPEKEAENTPKNDRANDGPAKRQTQRAKNRAKPPPATPGNTNVP
jgi:AAA domain